MRLSGITSHTTLAGGLFDIKRMSVPQRDKIEQSLQSSRDTLALANRLQNLSDANKAIQKLERHVRNTTGIRLVMFDFSV